MPITESTIQKIALKVFNQQFAPALRRSKLNMSSLNNDVGYTTIHNVKDNYLSIEWFNSLFKAVDSNGDPILPNDGNTSNIDSIKAMFGFWTNQYISALGQGSGGGGGGGSLATLTDVALSSPQQGQVLQYDAVSTHWVNGIAIVVSAAQDGQVLTYNASTQQWVNGSAGVDMSTVWAALAESTNEQIAASHLSTALASYVTSTDLSTALASYVTSTSLSTTLADYVTSTALTTTLADYVTATSLATTLASYASQQWVGQNYVSIAFFNRLFQAFAPLAQGETTAAQVEPNDLTTTIDNIKAMFGLWTEQYLSALGLSSGGGGVTLNEPLESINNASLGAPTTANVAIVWNGIAWTYGTTGSSYTLPTASASVLGGVKVGTTLAIDASGVLNQASGIATAGTYKSVTVDTYGRVTAGSNPTTLSGYGITDAARSADLENYLPLSAGSGKTLTGALYTNKIINLGSAQDNAILTRGLNGASTTGTLDNLYINHGHDGNVFLCYGGGNGGKVLIGYSENTSSNYKLSVNGTVYAGYFIKDGGTSNQFLKADGSVDSSSYVTSSGVTSVATGTGLTGGTITTTGTISINSTYQTYISHGESAYNSLSNYLPLTGGSLSGILNISAATADAIKLYRNNTSNGGTYVAYYANNQSTNFWRVGAGNDLKLNWQYNGSVKGQIDTSGDLSIVGKLECSTEPTSSSSEFKVVVNSMPIIRVASSGTILCPYDYNGGFVAIRSGGETDTTHTKEIILLSNGNVGVSSASPSYKLEVGGTGYYSGTLTTNKIINLGSAGTNAIVTRGLNGADENGNLDNLYINNGHNGNVLICYGGGSVGIGNMSPSYKLHVSGDIYATGGVTALSDARHKDIIRDTMLSVEQIAQMPSVVYRWNDGREDDGLHVGSIAQNWQSVLPEVVLTANDEEHTLSLQYGVCALVSAITIAKRVTNHEQRIKELEKENMRLRTELEQLRLNVA